MVLRPEAGSEPESALPRRQRGRVGARQLQGQRDHGAGSAPVHRGLPHRRSCGRVEERLRLHPRRVHRPLRGTAFRARRVAGASRTARRRDDRAAPRRGRLHLRRRDRASGVARRKARPAAHEASVSGGAGARRLTHRREQRRDDGDSPADHRDGRRRVRQARRAGLTRDSSGLDLRTCREARELRDRERHEHARVDLRPRRRHSGRPPAQSSHSRRLVDSDPEGR